MTPNDSCLIYIPGPASAPCGEDQKGAKERNNNNQHCSTTATTTTFFSLNDDYGLLKSMPAFLLEKYRKLVPLSDDEENEY